MSYRYAKGEGKGVLADLSAGGCRIRGLIKFAPGMRVRLQLWLPDQAEPMSIEQATVPWIRGEYFGVSFPVLHENQRSRLANLVKLLHAAQEDEVAAIPASVFGTARTRSSP
ncbi:hypothetical protein W02_31620 [Nitrospira sp. KM1]|nr:hypothetical protein W02_31620 [Nitrospira sp. KM1]